MSNKTRLQTNNNNLQSILNKVNALPEAGSGGGSVESCTVRLVSNGPGDCTVYYVSPTNGVTSISFKGMMEEPSITVQKNTILCWATGSLISVTGSATKLYGGAINVAGDCSVIYNG